MQRWISIRLVVVAVLMGVIAPSSLHATSAMLGPADPVTIDQPRVTVELLDRTTGASLGPGMHDLFLLDTGAQSILVAGSAVAELNDSGYTTVDTFLELGLGGASVFDLSDVYDFDFADFDGIFGDAGGTRHHLYDVRLLSKETANFGSFGGIVGTPAMVGRVTTMDLGNMIEGDLGFDYMGAYFGDTIPDAAAGTERFSAPIELVAFPPLPQGDPGDPMPTYGPLPFISARLRHGDNASGGSFVFDTGAQLSMLSTRMAFELGLDANGDGNLDDDATAWTEFQGVSGVIEVPVFAIEEFVLPTDQGVDLVWTDLELPVYDIDPAIGGIFGCELLTTGWFRAVFETGEPGAFIDVHIDFRDDETAQIVIDMNTNYDQLVQTVSTPGDANEDGLVDLDDFVILKQRFMQTGMSWGDADFNADFITDLDDFVLLKQNFLTAADVPEPTSLLILLAGAAAIRRRR